MRLGPLIALGFVLLSIPAFALEAKSIAVWMILPAVVIAAAGFIIVGCYFIVTAMVVALERRSRGLQLTRLFLLCVLGVFFTWAGGSALYAFVFKAMLNATG